MKASCKMTLFVSTAAVILFTSLACGAAEKEDEKIWQGEGPRYRGGQFELTDEVIEHVMERLKETDPAKAEELSKLRKKEPEKFKAELREIMGGRFRFAVRASEGGEREERGGFGQGRWDREREMTREQIREIFAEHLEWLKANYPEEEAELAEMKEKEPELYRRRLWLSRRRYGRIAEAEKENPQLAEVLKKDLELKKKRDKLLRKIGEASEGEKKKLVADLEKIVSSRFDLIVKRKQIAYEQLLKELEELKERVKESEAEVEKWKKVKSDKLKERLEELINRTEKFRWD